MLDDNEQKNIGVLIDADNTPPKKLRAILQEIAVHGHIITKRAYGDFSLDTLKNWKYELNDNAIIPVQQFAYTQGKNSSDSAMIIDAMDLLYTDKYDSIALVSSDSDFTKLATRLRESQIYVFGVGQKKTPQSFVSACDDFIYIENLSNEEEDAAVEEAAKLAEEKLKKKRSPCPPSCDFCAPFFLLARLRFARLRSLGLCLCVQLLELCLRLLYESAFVFAGQRRMARERG